MAERQVTAADKRKMNRTIRSAVMLEIIRAEPKKVGQIDPELMPTDRIMQRWAVSIGSGMPSEEWEQAPKARPTALDDESSTIIDQIVLHAPQRYRLLLLPWYKGTGSSTTIQARLGVTRYGLYFEWRCSLFYVRQEIRRSEHQDLIDLLDVFMD
jgi:hypothetical protein